MPRIALERGRRTPDSMQGVRRAIPAVVGRKLRNATARAAEPSNAQHILPRGPRNGFAFVVAFLVVVSLLVAACKGHTVDNTTQPFVDVNPSPPIVDQTPPPGIDNGGPRQPANTKPTPPPGVPIAQANSTFTTPPGNYTQNATISIDEKMALIGKDVAKIYVWSEKGSHVLVLAEGQSATLSDLGVTVQPQVIGTQSGIPVAVFVVNGKPTEGVGLKEETYAGGVYIFVSDLFMNNRGG